MSGPPLPSRIAVHEAGHAVIAWALGFSDPGPISTVPATGVFGGICFPGMPPAAFAQEAGNYGYETPLACMPAEVRRWVECDVMVSLAGDVAEELFAWEGQTPHQESGDIDADRRASLPQRERRLIARARARADARPWTEDADDVLKWLLAIHLHDFELALAHRRLLLLDCRRILGLHARPLLGLARELDEHGTLAGDYWHPYLTAASMRSTMRAEAG